LKGKDFKDISLRGRAAFGICCLENALQFYNLNDEGWEILLHKLWDITSTPYEMRPYPTGHEHEGSFSIKVEDLMYIINEYTPECVLEFSTYEAARDDGSEIMTEGEFTILHKTYQKTNQAIDTIIDMIWSIGTDSIYSGINDYLPITIKYVQKIIDVMQSKKILMPDIALFKQYLFDPKARREDYGWGLPFDGKKLSKILK